MKERLRHVVYKGQKRVTLKAVTSPGDRLGEDGLASAQNSCSKIRNLNFFKTIAATTGKCLETWSVLHNFDSNFDLSLYALIFPVVIDRVALLPVTNLLYVLSQVRQPSSHCKP